MRFLTEDDYFDHEDDYYDDPSLYPSGKIEGMDIHELRDELERQLDIQGSLGDVEYINDAAVERAEMRIRIVEAEMQSRIDLTN